MKASFNVTLIDLSDVIRIHYIAIDRFGGRHGIHDQKLLESAINHSWMIIAFGDNDDIELYNLAAAYFFHIIKNHPFIDGNKRTGLMTAVEFMYKNGFELESEFEDLYKLALDTAASHIPEKEIAIFFKKIMKKIA